MVYVKSDIMKFDPITSRRSFEDIAESIRKTIVDGSFDPGARLPSEKELAHQFQVGRQAVREGLRILEAGGLVRVKKGKSWRKCGKVTNSTIKSFARAR